MEGRDSHPSASSSNIWREPAFYLLAIIVAVIYFSRIAALPIVGEEARWARGAAQMLETGDWIVLRQQGQVFPERPPLTCWSMALAALAWGDLDPVAIRLPSVIAIVLTSLVIYGYARSFLSSTGALVGGLAYATFGQVLQIGRHGESEALFTLLLGGAILVWHVGYLRSRTQLGTWAAAYSLAALAAFVSAGVISYWEPLTGLPAISFQWILAGSLTVSAVVGWTVSWLMPEPARDTQ